MRPVVPSIVLAVAFLGGMRASAVADGRTEKFRNGCEVKREWKPNGEYKEEIKCD